MGFRKNFFKDTVKRKRHNEILAIALPTFAPFSGISVAPPNKSMERIFNLEFFWLSGASAQHQRLIVSDTG